MDILQGLLTNEARYGYRSCPCRLAWGVKDKDADIVCPCVYRDPDIKEFGSCFCGLYVSVSWNEEKIEHRQVPERRPKEKRADVEPFTQDAEEIRQIKSVKNV